VTAMKFDYREFRVNASPLDEGGDCYARAKVYRCASAGGEAVEVKYLEDLGDYPSDADTIEAAQCWATQWSPRAWRPGSVLPSSGPLSGVRHGFQRNKRQ
jgi:hypothetical protein